MKKGKEELRLPRQRETNKKVPLGGKGFVAVEAIFYQLFSNALIDQKRRGQLTRGRWVGERGRNRPDEVFPVERIHSESIHPFSHTRIVCHTLYAKTSLPMQSVHSDLPVQQRAQQFTSIFLDILESGNFFSGEWQQTLNLSCCSSSPIYCTALQLLASHGH